MPGIIKDAKLEALRPAFNGAFKQGLAGAQSELAKIAMMIPSSTNANAYGWLGDFPQMKEWVNDRHVGSIKEYGHTIVNKKYEATLGVKRTDIEDDNLGMYGTIMTNLGYEVVRFRNENAYAVLKNGDATLIYDGQNLFDKDHPVNPKTDGTGVDVSVSNLFGAAGNNKVPWYLLDTSRAIKPLIVQERTKPELENITDTEQSHVFMKDEYLMGVRYRSAFTSAFWQLSVKSYEELSADKFNEAVVAMMSFKGHGGRPLGIRPTTLVVPASLRAKAFEIIKAERLANGASNTNFGAVEVLVSSYL